MINEISAEKIVAELFNQVTVSERQKLTQSTKEKGSHTQIYEKLIQKVKEHDTSFRPCLQSFT